MNKPLRVGIVGYGYATKTFHAPLVSATPGLALCAVATSDPQKLSADWPHVQALPDAHSLFAQPNVDIAVIATPNDTHCRLAEAALRAGKHVVVDKPFVLNVSEAQQLHAAARRFDRLLSVFHNRRWDSDFLSLRQMLASEAIGRVVHVESHFDRFRPNVRQRWREVAGPGSGQWYDLGSHLLDQTVQLFGMPAAITLHTALQREGAQTDDWFHAVLRYEELRVVLHGAAVVAKPGPRWAVHGTRGSWIRYGLDPQEDQLKSGARPSRADWGHDPVTAELTVAQDAHLQTTQIPSQPGNYLAFYSAFRDAVLGQGPNPVSVEQATQVVALIEKGQLSAREGREVLVP